MKSHDIESLFGLNLRKRDAKVVSLNESFSIEVYMVQQSLLKA